MTPARGQCQADKVVDPEQCPHGVDHELGRVLGPALRVGEHLPGVDAQDDGGGAGQRPLRGSLPRPQPSARADVSRHAPMVDGAWDRAVLRSPMGTFLLGRRRGGGCPLRLGWGAHQLGGSPDLVEPGLDLCAGVVEP